MKRNIKYHITVFAVAVAAAFSCQSEDLLKTDDVQDGYVRIDFHTQVPAMDIVQTKAVDPDGGGVQNMQVFCFDANGIFITTVSADITPDSPAQGSNASLSGKISLTVPEHAVTLQLVGNQNLTFFEEDRYRGMTEIEVMASLEASAGRMIYWARKTADELRDNHTSADNPVKLLRNQAKFTLAVGSGVDFIEEGWIIVNSNSFGTVAPFNSETETFEAPTLDNPFITVPDNNAKLGDFLDVRTVAEEYIFETPNSESGQIDFIVKGKQNGGESQYYRISIVDKNGEYLPILRNHHYTVNITGNLYYGVNTFAEALETPPTNNVWVAVADDISQVSDGNYSLTVEKTSVVVGEDDFVLPDHEYVLKYTVSSLGDGAVSQAEVSWLDGNDVALNAFQHSFDTATGEGTITINLNSMGEKSKREGTLQVTFGQLSRKIKVVTVKKQQFTPAWITTNIYGGETGQNVTMMFHVPDDCPEELFPMDVLVTVNDMDVRNASGMVLPVIFKGDEGYGADNGVGYKYVLNVTGPGVQRIYLETILAHDTEDQVSVTIEARNFETLTKTATFKEDTDYRILIHNLRSYVGTMPADEVIYYYLVPQKINARVEFDTHLGQVFTENPGQGNYDESFEDALGTYYAKYVAPNADFTTPDVDEFLLYSENLDHNHDLPAGTTYYFDFYKIDASKWSSTAGRVLGLYRNTNVPSEMGSTLHLKTNKPKADEVVRIATNPNGSPSITTGTKGEHVVVDYTSATCTGTGLYRSAVFELATFHPFHFSAQVKAGTDVFGDASVKGENEEVVTDVLLAYNPGQSIDIEFDITSFKSEMKNVADAEQMSVDPFGTEFEIYIDAPMLELDVNDTDMKKLIDAGKLWNDTAVPGRVVYKVDADRESERTNFSSAAALAVDGAELDLFRNPVTVNQAGERKVITFKTKKIVSAGEITISSDESKVVYYKKTFRVQNSSITGKIMFNKDGVLTPVPVGAFVPFEAEPSYNRIGTVTVEQADGTFELRLRAEYEYEWDRTKVKFQYTDTDGTIYEKEYQSLSNLYSTLTANNVVLEK